MSFLIERKDCETNMKKIIAEVKNIVCKNKLLIIIVPLLFVGFICIAIFNYLHDDNGLIYDERTDYKYDYEYDSDWENQVNIYERNHKFKKIYHADEKGNHENWGDEWDRCGGNECA